MGIVYYCGLSLICDQTFVVTEKIDKQSNLKSIILPELSAAKSISWILANGINVYLYVGEYIPMNRYDFVDDRLPIIAGVNVISVKIVVFFISHNCFW